MRGLTSDERWHLEYAASAHFENVRHADEQVLMRLMSRGLVVRNDTLCDEGIHVEYKASKTGRLLLTITAATGCDS